LGSRLRLEQALDDWIVSRNYIHGRDPEIEKRLDSFADALVARVREGVADEIVLLGHSLGATFAIDIAARALVRDPALGRHGVSVSILTVGATIPKCALHPDGHRIRGQIARVVNETSIAWVEYQSRSDPISFYRFHPAKLARIARDAEGINDKPLVRRVQIQNMLSPESLRRYRFRVLRRHHQFVMANEKPAPYDYFLMICGPVALTVWACSPLGLLDHYDADGGWRASSSIAA
jgi:thioesterase domain-containing protein